jgi:para-nitrobenzyl esterase
MSGAVVETQSGKVAGIAGAVRAFLGIPFAAPPVGALRWQPPQPAAPWSGVRDAAKFGPDPMQAPGAVLRGPRIDEDCLTLNVWTPAKPGEKLPVMVWLFGGGFTAGSGSTPRTDGAALAAKGVVVVTVNYRVGVLGFLAHPELTAESPHRASGNYGLLDQIAALAWVRDNVAGFGGDPGKVTLFGVSAGGACVSLLLASPLAEGLVHQAILESAGSYRPLGVLADAEALGESVMGKDLAALRRLPAAELVARTGKFNPPARGLTVPRLLRPIIDGYAVVHDEVPAYLHGRYQQVPTIVGSNADEGGFFIDAMPIKTAADYSAYMTRNFGASTDAALAVYPAPDDAAVPGALAGVFGDTQFTYGARSIARAMARRQPKVFRYLFSHHPGGRADPPMHSEEVQYVFGTYRFDNPDGLEFTVQDNVVAEAMMGAWARFAQTGDPNGPGLAPWPAYDSAADVTLEFGNPIRTRSGWRAHEMSFLDRYFDWEAKVAAESASGGR